MTLQEGCTGSRYVVTQMKLPIETERRLESLGLMENGPVAVLRKKRKGPMVIKVRGTRFAIGPGISSRIEIKE